MDRRRVPLSNSRQLPAPKSGSSKVAPVKTSRQLPAPETRDSSHQTPIHTARTRPTTESPDPSSKDPLRTTRQLPAPETPNVERYMKTSRQLAGPDSSRSEPPSRSPGKTSRKNFSRIRFLEQSSTPDECVREDYSRNHKSRGEHLHKSGPHQRDSSPESSGKEVSRKVLPPAANKTHSTTGQPRITPPGPSRLTDTSPKGPKGMSTAYGKTLTTTYVTQATKGPGKSIDTPGSYGTIQVPKTQLPKYATEGLTKQELEVQQVLSIQALCPKGFVWLKQQSGWRCEGASHWMTDDQARRLARGEHPAAVGCEIGFGPVLSWTKPPKSRPFLDYVREAWDVGRTYAGLPRMNWLPSMVTSGRPQLYQNPVLDNTSKESYLRALDSYKQSIASFRGGISSNHLRKSYIMCDVKLRPMGKPARNDGHSSGPTDGKKKKSSTRHYSEGQHMSRKYVCPRGYIWIKQEVGWRCKKGDHWLSDRQARRIQNGEDLRTINFQTGVGPPANMTTKDQFIENPYRTGGPINLEVMRYISSMEKADLPMSHEHWRTGQPWEMRKVPSFHKSERLRYLDEAGCTKHRETIPDWAKEHLTREEIAMQKEMTERLMPCPHGYIWERENSQGWKCAGGMHRMKDEEFRRIYRGEKPEEVFKYRNQKDEYHVDFCAVM